MLKKVLLVVSVILITLVLGTIVAGYVWRMPGDKLTPAGIKLNTSYYINMPDGARIAADLWLPEDLEPDQRIPTVIEGTRYWREAGLTLPGKIAAMAGVGLPGVHPSGYNAFFPTNGYAMLTIDVRGTGASSGVHETEYSLKETADYRHILEWVTRQSWSSGDVFAVGISYSGTSAELMTTVNHPALKAVAPLYSDFDAQMQLATPGGVYQPAFIELWSQLVAAMDRNDFCGVITATDTDTQTTDCLVPSMLISGVKPVDGEIAFLKPAVASHNSPNVAQMVQQLKFRDSTWGTTEVLPSENLPFGLRAAIEQSNVPMFVVTGWFDAATTNGALARFATYSNVQEVWVGPFSHGGDHDTDPFKTPDAPSVWQGDEQLQRVLAFFEQHRTDKTTHPPMRGKLNYYVNGAEVFKQTEVWPPPHLTPLTLYLGADNTLNHTMPQGRRFDRYEVDPTTATSSASRWMTQLGGNDVLYDRRAEMAEKSLTYTSVAFNEDSELTGSIILDLWMTSDQAEGALHVYLEDVAPDGTVRYLSEGVLNLEHRATSENPAYPMFGPTHSFLQQDAERIPTGQLFSYSTTLYATSALIKQGHRLRLNLTGADAASFARMPNDGPMPHWRIYSGATSPSSVTVYTAPWKQDSVAH